MLKYKIFYNKYNKTHLSILNKLQILLNSQKTKFIEDDKNYTIIFCIGGDGSFLYSLNKILNSEKIESIKKKYFINILASDKSFGYYINNKFNQIKKLLLNIEKVIAKKVKSFPLLEISINKKNYYAINDFKVLNCKNTVDYNLVIDNTLFSVFKSSGFNISTKNGDSGFNKSLLGPKIISKHEFFIFSNIFLNLQNTFEKKIFQNSLVVDSDKTIEIQLKNNNYNKEYLYFFVDSNELKKINKEVESIKIKNLSNIINII